MIEKNFRKEKLDAINGILMMYNDKIIKNVDDTSDCTNIKKNKIVFPLIPSLHRLQIINTMLHIPGILLMCKKHAFHLYIH